MKNGGVIGIELEAAVQMILERVSPVRETETLPLLDAWGRILAEPVWAELDNPPFPRSPLDGYTFAAASSRGASEVQPVCLKEAGCVYAGQYHSEAVEAGQAVRIMTGAPIPAGCDCVVRLEDVKVLPSGEVLIFTEMKPWQNYCFQGEDFRKGTLLAETGTVLDAVNLGILASAGMATVKVRRKPRIALLVTGDEVILPGMPLMPGKLYGSNLHVLYGRLLELGMEVVQAEAVADDPEAVAAEIRKLRDTGVDAIVTTGGVSVGDKDIFHQVLPILGAERLFWRVKMKPGTPAMFAVLDGLPMFHLSGNPFAALATFDLLVCPALSKLNGKETQEQRTVQAVLQDGFAKASGQRRFIRGMYENGIVRIRPTDSHSSGILSSMRGCNCLIDIPAGTEPLEPGREVRVVLL
ncbi:MAG: molybdopterin molybdotransferase MoeA [Eubacteriales bacterium]|nr:molybdopterin molybdotransferase MoeA [Eubacteriales bacterium]